MPKAEWTLCRNRASRTLERLWEVRWLALVRSWLPPKPAAQTLRAFTTLLLPSKLVLSRRVTSTLKGTFKFLLAGPDSDPFVRQPIAWECMPTLLPTLPPFLQFLQMGQGTFVYRVKQCVFLRHSGKLSARFLWVTPFTFFLKWMVLV